MAEGAADEAQRALQAKVVLVGETCVGKTSILWRYTTLRPAPGALPASRLGTVGIDFKVKTIYFNDTTIRLQIWDTAGQERFHTFTTSFFRGAHGFVLVYDITNAKSFQDVRQWMQDIHEKTSEDVEVILLGNKCDKETERVIPKNSGEKLAWEYGIPFFETSAKNNINIDNAFLMLAKEILNKSSCALIDRDTVDLKADTKKRTCCKL